MFICSSICPSFLVIPYLILRLFSGSSDCGWRHRPGLHVRSNLHFGDCSTTPSRQGEGPTSVNVRAGWEVTPTETGNLGASMGRGHPSWDTGNLGASRGRGHPSWVTENLGGPPLLGAGNFGTCRGRGLSSKGLGTSGHAGGEASPLRSWDFGTCWVRGLSS